ncbi:MAG: cytochrome B6 [Candidatus Scalinduaceae bacterium]
MAEIKDESKEKDEVIVRMSTKEWEYVKDINVKGEFREGFDTLTVKEQDYTVKHLRDSVGIEFIAGLIFTFIIMVWSLFMDAPLKELADPSNTPIDERAPWYFIGLQELLIYFDPWLAGVVIPTILLVGLIVIPFIDPNKETGIGRYTLRDRPVAVSVFGFGFAMWYILIIIGQFFRGPGRMFYWPWEDKSVLKDVPVTELVNFHIAGGLAFFILYFGIGVIVPQYIFKNFCKTLGVVRYYIFMALFLIMLLIPIKIFLRYVFDVRYILSLPEIFNTVLNF